MSKWLPGFTSRFIDVGAARLHCVIGGKGERTVVLLHGWPATWRAWRKVMPLIQAEFCIVALDLRGLGESDAPTEGYDKWTVARDVHAVIAALGIERPFIVGHDLGAVVTYAFLKQFPQDVARAVLIDDPIPGLAGWEDVRGKWPRWHFAFNALPDLPEQLVSGKEYEFLSWFYRNAFQKHAISKEDAQIYAAAYSRPESLRAGFEYYRAFERDAADARADRLPIKTPILAIGGEHSPWCTILSEQLAGEAEQLQSLIAPACGHFVPEEQPDWLAAHLLAFFHQSRS